MRRRRSKVGGKELNVWKIKGFYFSITFKVGYRLDEKEKREHFKRQLK